MGGKNSNLNQEQLDEYVQLTYLTKFEILYVFDRLKEVSNEIANDIAHRYHINDIMDAFPQLKHNPFRDRLFSVFSSEKDEHFSFEDVLDLCSTLSVHCPLSVKAAWAFKVFDFDEDNQITKEDLFLIIDRLTYGSELLLEEKDHICDILLQEMDLQHTGGMSQLEFLHSITKIVEFSDTFSFRL